MRIFHQTLAIVLVCTLGGLSVIGLLFFRYERLQQLQRENQEYLIVLRDLEHLQTMTAQWFVTIDLFFGYEQTYLAKGVGKQARQLKDTWLLLQDRVPRLRDEAAIRRVVSGIQSISYRVQDLAVSSDADLSSAWAEGLGKVDLESSDVIVLTQEIGDTVLADGALLEDELAESEKSFVRWGVSAVVLYVLLVGLVWRWASNALVQPIERLTELAEEASSQVKVMDFPQRAGPEEVRRLTQSFEAFVDKLKAASHQAGIAEVITSVLHNIGNVLNSLNVSAQMVQSQVSELKTDGPGLISNAIAEYKAKGCSDPFFKEHPVGKELESYLLTLGQRLEKDKNALQEEVSYLQQKIEHIKTIFSAQRDMAKHTDLVETIQVRTVVEELLLMAFAAEEVEDVTISNEIEESIVIETSKNKFIEIVVNLVRNALDSLAESQVVQPHIRFSASSLGDERVTIQVEDNGMGIKEEDALSIFQHGFTTKKEGNGFGLHSCATKAEEMGGSLNFLSDGENAGALFILCLPCRRLN